MENCLKCKSCRLLRDSDPCEFRIFCNEMKMDVAVMVRKEDLEEEASLPDWCPLEAQP